MNPFSLPRSCILRDLLEHLCGLTLYAFALGIIAASFAYSCEAYADDILEEPLPPTPRSSTQSIDGVQYECFDLENYRLVVSYVKAIAPALRLRGLELAQDLEAEQRESALLEDKSSLLELKVKALQGENAVLIESLADTEDLLKRERDKHRLVTVVLTSAVAVLAISTAVFTTAWVVERK